MDTSLMVTQIGSESRSLADAAEGTLDGRNAANVPFDIDRATAELGLIEFVDVMHDLRADHPAPPPIHLVATDSSWTDTMFPDAAGAPLSIVGACSDLLLSLWGRRPSQDSAIAAALAAIDLS